MSTPEGDNAEEQRLAFGRYVLDLRRGSLLLDGREVALRPKTFAVLRFLVEHPGRLVSKEELLATVWPNLVVTDDTLVQSIGELRRALGEAGARLIVTVPRRGYRFETTEAPPDRRKSRGWHALRFRWKYGILAPLAIGITVLVLWLVPKIREALDVGSVLAAKPAIAVLPFENLGHDPAREYLADGLTQDLINSLGRFSALTVMSWNAVATYKGAVARPGEIARVLAVRYQVEGSVSYSGERMRVSAQLVDVQGRVLWSARFDEAPTDVFALQDRITREIAGALAIRITQFEQRRVSSKPTASFDAYDYVLRARPALLSPTRANIVDARALLRRAIELDPNYAAAHAALGETFHVAISMGWAESPDEYWKRVDTHANEALRLDESDVRARVLLARSFIAYNHYDQAEAQIERAIAVNPSDADALAGRGNVLVWLGKTDAAIETLELAQRIDPELNTFDRFGLSLAYYLKRRYPDCIEQAELNQRKTSGAPFNMAILAAAYAQANRPADAARMVEGIRRADPTFDATTFGNKFLKREDLAHLREGLRKAGLLAPGA
ncbi:MAG TPA: winged helix-turn-helix domain-containing protein [Steroidobacteraceae bacterium]|nr:winged helix-turn-helix domain-containing protein [Steroidobacteraceae bacterium]